MPSQIPETRYAKSGDVSIAYQADRLRQAWNGFVGPRYRSGGHVAARAGPGEVLVSQTVRDLVAGSGIEFEERGAAELKGVPGDWRLFAVESA